MPAIVIYDFNDPASPRSTSLPVNVGELIPAIATPSRDGYAFQYWSETGSSDPQEFDFKNRKAPLGKLTLYAIWSTSTPPLSSEPSETSPMPKVTVTFMANGETVSTKTIVKGEKIDELPQNPTKEGYTFVGWYTKKDGEGEKLQKHTVAKADVTYYACFEGAGVV